MKNKGLPIFLAGGLLWSVAQADTPQIHGFLAQGYLRSEHNSFYGPDTLDGSWRLREAGLNASWRPVPKVMFSAQGMIRQAGERDIPAATLDYAFLTLNLASSLDRRDDLLLGRIKLPLGFYNETRDVPVTRPSILLPQSIYFDRTRDLALSADGLMWVGWRQRGGNTWTGKIGMMTPRVRTPDVEDALFQTDLTGELEPGQLLVWQFRCEGLPHGFNMGVSGLYAWTDYPGTSDMPTGRVRFLPVILSVAMDRERWSLTAEYALRTIAYQGFAGTPIEEEDMTGESFYGQGVWRFTPKLSALIRFDRLLVDRDDPDGRRYADESGQPDHLRFARDWTLGVTWDASESWRLQVEHHWVDGTAWLTRIDRQRGSLRRRWSLWAAMLAYRF